MTKRFAFLKHPALYVGIGLALGAVLRIYHLVFESLWLDETTAVFVATSSLKAIMTQVYDYHPPLYVLILKFWLFFFGHGEFAARFPSVIFGVLSLYVVYRLASLLYDRVVGVVATFFSATSLFLIAYSQEARNYSLLALLSATSVYLFCKFLKKASRKEYFCLLVVNILLSYTHIFGLLVIAAEFIFFLVFLEKTRQSFVRYMSLLIFNGLVFSPFIVQVVKKIEWTTTAMRWIPTVDFGRMFVMTMAAYSGRRSWLMFGLCGFFLLLGVLKLKSVSHPNKGKIFGGFTVTLPYGFAVQILDAGILLLLWLLVPFVFSCLFSTLVFPIYTPRNLIVGAPAFYILLSAGVRNFSGLKLKTMIVIVAVMLCSTLFFRGGVLDHLNTRTKENWRDLSRFIAAHEEPGDVVLVYPTYVGTAFQYYYQGGSEVTSINPTDMIPDLKTNEDLVRARRIWLIYRLVSSSQQEFLHGLHDGLVKQLSGFMIFRKEYHKTADIGLFLYELKT